MSSRKGSTAGSLVVKGLIVFCIVFGAALWYYQNRAYYERVDGLTEVAAYGDAFPVSNYKGIDAETSPLKLRACFTVDWDYFPSDEFKLVAEPLVAPSWFDCFDAQQITLDLLNDKAVAILAAENEPYGFSRFIAQYEDGRAFMWRQINECGNAAFAGEDLPENCPPPPAES